MGLEESTSMLGDDVRRFADLCNELAFRMWTSITGKGSISARSLVLSPFAVTSLLAMVFLGARGPTSGQMNDVLRLDEMVTFNPHQVLQNVTDSVLNAKNYGVATAAFVRQLYSDKGKGKILDFYKERAQQYYDGHIEEVGFNVIGDILRRRTNLLIKRQTLGRVPEYLRGSSLSLRPPLAAFSANIFQTDCQHASTEGRDGEMYFVVRPSTRQRRLVPVPAAVWRSNFLAGYEPGLDATAVCLGADSVVGTPFILPGQQGQVAPGDGLARLEQRLIETSYRRGGWSRLLRSLLVRPGLELQIPRFSHRSVLNVTGALRRMGLKDLFDAGRADLKGLNGLSNDLHLSDMVQINTFSTCGEETIGARHHTETYPISPQRVGRKEHRLFGDDSQYLSDDYSHLPLALRPRQARIPTDNPRLRFDRPFLYVVRHNPTGMILHMGRFNPRLLP
uniref:Serpin-8 n=1 Tax=Nilaparvata lugens TaxID=108931 RepID=M9ZRQ0_NILLU|nr:serpin-8 [Nilaparvata lugens]